MASSHKYEVEGKFLFGFLKKKQRVPGLVGLAITDEGILFTHAAGQQGQTPHLNICESLQYNNNAANKLSKYVNSQGLEGANCNFVLSSQDYNLVLVEAPKVKAEEMAQAVRWKVKDLIDLPIEEVALDFFEVPDDAYRSQGDMVYVVAVRKKRIIEIRDLVNEAGLKLKTIDIPEMALKNLAGVFADDQNGLAVIDLRETGSTLSLSKNGSVYLTRRINTRVDNDAMHGTDWDMVKERLVLEIQRSLDYFESQMGQSQVSRLLISPLSSDGQRLITEINEAMAVRVEMMDFKEILTPDKDLPLELQQECLLAIGGALRQEGAKA